MRFRVCGAVCGAPLPRVNCRPGGLVWMVTAVPTIEVESKAPAELTPGPETSTRLARGPVQGTVTFTVRVMASLTHACRQHIGAGTRQGCQRASPACSSYGGRGESVGKSVREGDEAGSYSGPIILYRDGISSASLPEREGIAMGAGDSKHQTHTAQQ